MICIELRLFAWNISYRTPIDNETESTTHKMRLRARERLREQEKIKENKSFEISKSVFVMETNLLGTEWVNKLKMWTLEPFVLLDCAAQCVVFLTLFISVIVRLVCGSLRQRNHRSMHLRLGTGDLHSRIHSYVVPFSLLFLAALGIWGKKKNKAFTERTISFYFLTFFFFFFWRRFLLFSPVFCTLKISISFAWKHPDRCFWFFDKWTNYVTQWNVGTWFLLFIIIPRK